MPDASEKVHYHAGSDIRTEPSGSFNNQGTCLLSEKKGSYHECIGLPCKTQMGTQPQCNDKYHRNVDSQEPLQGEPSYVGTPVPERDIDNQNGQAGQNEF